MCSESLSGRIRRLPDDVVNRIAAGEVVCRPSAALKELIENSLDAGATSITVTAREGGLKLIQVSDDGKGIPSEDLPLLCERFATSKISSYEDLQEVTTFGFRGEALASMSQVSRLTVLTKTQNSSVAYKASYTSGSLRETPEPTAGTDGTTITLEEMFYNLPTRRRALKSSSDEYRLILDVVTRYAIHYPHVSFVCRRQQAGPASRVKSSSDFRSDRNASVADNIRTGFGNGLWNETAAFTLDVTEADTTVSAVVSTANYSMKKGIFILFINGRLVDCHPLKRAIWAVYASFLPKNAFPFVYVALKMRQSNIDVNVHPTKKEVRFLHEATIIGAVVDELNLRLKGTETSRTFLAQAVLAVKTRSEDDELAEKEQPDATLMTADSVTGVEMDKEAERGKQQSFCELPFRSSNAIPDERAESGHALEISSVKYENEAPVRRRSAGGSARPFEGTIQAAKRPRQMFFELSGKQGLTDAAPESSDKFVYPKDKVRTGSNAPVGLYDIYLSQSGAGNPVVDIQSKRRRHPSSIPLLTSVEALINAAKQGCHRGLSHILKEHLFIGLASAKYALLQHATKLLLANIDQLLIELTYQQVLIKFSDLDVFQLKPPAPVFRLIHSYLSGLPSSALESRRDPESCTTILMEKAKMLSEYFGIVLEGSSVNEFVVTKLPLPFPCVMPDLNLLGKFLYHLAIATDWSAEEPCFRDISRNIGDWYGKHWKPFRKGGKVAGNNEGTVSPENAENGNAKENTESTTQDDQREWVLRHVLFAAMKTDFYPPRRFFTEEVLREITSTSRLYKVFERC